MVDLLLLPRMVLPLLLRLMGEMIEVEVLVVRLLDMVVVVVVIDVK
jgi:hypothetical protein